MRVLTQSGCWCPCTPAAPECPDTKGDAYFCPGAAGRAPFDNAYCLQPLLYSSFSPATPHRGGQLGTLSVATEGHKATGKTVALTIHFLQFESSDDLMLFFWNQTRQQKTVVLTTHFFLGTDRDQQGENPLASKQTEEGGKQTTNPWTPTGEH
ncbi:hypothetical protein NDU88_004324 [Pleurodeles waltl]|uniref:Uncharacterized protein n=1 Tax=Pleurodeles waltl TaxID=8319 RepID=A0AAV7UEU9_PLEWA|nr:hypothetical protein NDU88_004324 [Pleurodeles waltl]